MLTPSTACVLTTPWALRPAPAIRRPEIHRVVLWTRRTARSGRHDPGFFTVMKEPLHQPHLRLTRSPEGPGSVSRTEPSRRVRDTFTSRYRHRAVRLHAVIGGDGPPLLLVHGWPETWYAWRLLMPALARDFQVIAVDQRGIGLSDKPADGYDTGTLAGDLVGADGRARPRAVRRGRSRHRIRDQLRAGRGSPGPGRPRRARRDPRTPDVGRLTARVRPRAGQQPAVAHPVQPGREAARATHRGT